MGHIERKKRDKEVIRNKIFHAAIDIATAEGWDAVTVRRISSAIEYTTSIIYGHFESKDDLLAKIADWGFFQLYIEVEKAIAKEEDSESQLFGASMVNWQFALKNKALNELMFRMKPTNSDNAAKGMMMLKSVFVRLAGTEEVESLVLNWICLRVGSINLLLQNSKTDKERKSAQQLYTEFMMRFIQSITIKKNS